MYTLYQIKMCVSANMLENCASDLHPLWGGVLGTRRQVSYTREQ